MASYAEVASSGPSQSAEEASVFRAPPMPEVENRTNLETSDLIDVDSVHVSSVTSDFSTQSIQTDTQAQRIEREIYDEAIEFEKKASKKAKALKGKAKRNADNPVVLGNAAVAAAVVGIVGISAWKQYQSPEGFSWKAAFGFMGVLGAFGVGDYFVSKWLLEKYPPKE